MKNDKYRKSDRAFLNQDGFHEDATISWEMSVNDGGWGDGSLRIRDCSDTINLSIDFHDEAYVKNTQYKIDTLIKVLKGLRKELPHAHAALLTAQLEKAKNEKKK